jgi:hypothetical protein
LLLGKRQVDGALTLPKEASTFLKNCNRLVICRFICAKEFVKAADCLKKTTSGHKKCVDLCRLMASVMPCLSIVKSRGNLSLLQGTAEGA